jgi:hypothetical protein
MATVRKTITLTDQRIQAQAPSRAWLSIGSPRPPSATLRAVVALHLVLFENCVRHAARR